jgi:hypothetical protein
MFSRLPTTPALKKTLVLPSLYSAGSSCRANNTFSDTTLPSTNPCGIAFGAKIEYLKYGEYFSLIIIEKFYIYFCILETHEKCNLELKKKSKQTSKRLRIRISFSGIAQLKL